VPRDHEIQRRQRPGGRSARVRSAVLAATAELLVEGGYDLVGIPEVARRAGVHPTTIYRRWPTTAQLVGEALLERSQVLSPTPDTGSLEGDLARLVSDGADLIGSPAVRALFQVLLTAADATPEIAVARDRFWTAHLVEARGIVERAVARSEIPARTDPAALVDLVVGPALLRLLLMGQELPQTEIEVLVRRAIASLRASPTNASQRSG
jgi:AcrR family transcriptional regulator